MSRVSVLIPTFNRPTWLVESLNSVLSQDCDLEVLVLDNGSGPETESVLEPFDIDPRVKRFRVDTNGTVNPYAFLSEHVESEYVVFFTDDDRMLPGNLSRKVDFLEAHPGHGMVFSAANEIGPDGRLTGSGKIWQTWGEDVLSGAAEILLLNMTVSMPSCVFRSKHLHHFAKCVEFGLVADWALFLEIADVQDAAFLWDSLVEIRVHSGSDTNRNGRTGGFLTYYPKVWEHWLKRGVKPTPAAWDEMLKILLGLALEQHGNDPAAIRRHAEGFAAMRERYA